MESFHPNLRQYTRHQHNPRVLSRLDYILVSDDLANNCLSSKIIPGVQSDHSVVTLNFSDGQPSKGHVFGNSIAIIYIMILILSI